MLIGYHIDAFEDTDPGCKRANNEDFITFFEPGSLDELHTSGRLYIVADGVGGAAQGERASRYAAEVVLYEYFRYPGIEPAERLQQIIRRVGNSIHDFTEKSNSAAPIATTLVAAVIRGTMLTVANVGDSRAYLIRGENVRQLTHDHTEVGELVRDRLITKDQARHSKGKNRLNRSLGGERDVLVDVFADIPLQAGDKVLLCSDGLTRYVTDQDLSQLTATGMPKEVVERLINYAREKGGADNISVIFVAVGDPLEEGDIGPGGLGSGRISTPLGLADMPTQSFAEEPGDVLIEDRMTRGPGNSLLVRRPAAQLVGNKWVARQQTPFWQHVAVFMGILLVFVWLTFAILIWRSGGMRGVVEGITTTPTSVITNAVLLPTTFEPLPTLTATLLSVINMSDQTWICVYKANEYGSGLEHYLKIFGLAYDLNREYSYCVNVEDDRCLKTEKYEFDDDDEPVIHMEMWIIVDVSEEICTAKDGLWVRSD